MIYPTTITFKAWLAYHITKRNSFGDFAREAYNRNDFPETQDYQVLRNYVRENLPESAHNKVLPIPLETFTNLYICFAFELYLDPTTALKDHETNNYFTS